jgi:hypothetical protein
VAGPGIARLIRDEILRDLPDEQVSLLVNALNGDGKVTALYESWGYEPISTQPPSVDGPVLTAIGCGGFVRHRLLASSDTAGHVSVPLMLVCVDTASAPDGCQVVRCFVAWARR